MSVLFNTDTLRAALTSKEWTIDNAGLLSGASSNSNTNSSSSSSSSSFGGRSSSSERLVHPMASFRNDYLALQVLLRFKHPPSSLGIVLTFVLFKCIFVIGCEHFSFKTDLNRESSSVIA
jgi:hypothetical protein